MRRIVLVLLCAFLALPATAHAAWIWSPQTGWIGPSGAVKDTPQEQLQHAMTFFDQKDYKRARIEFKKLLKRYKDSHEAADAQYYLGRCQEEEGDYYAAFKEYRKMLEAYPSSARFEDTIERIYQIGNHFLAGRKRKVFGVAAMLPARDKAIEAYQAIIDNGPFSASGEIAQYKLGLAHLSLEEYEQAVTAFEQLIARYPQSPLVDDARFQLAQASLKGVFDPQYDQHPTDRAIDELKTFVKAYPDSSLSAKAVERLQVLKERRAAHEYLAGQFYERRKRPTSALIYYHTIVERFPETAWAPKALARIQTLQPHAP